MKPVSRKTESIATSNDTSSMFSIFAAARNACKGSILKFSMTFFFYFQNKPQQFGSSFFSFTTISAKSRGLYVRVREVQV